MKYDWKGAISINIIKLQIVGLWPPGNHLYSFNLYTGWTLTAITIFIYAHNFFQVLYMIFNINDLEAITSTAFINISELTGILKSYYLIQNMKILKKLMHTLTTKMFQPKTQFQKVLIDQNIKSWKTLYFLYWGMSSGALFFWSTFPILDKSIKVYRLPFMAWYPFNTKISPNYEIIYIYQVVSILCVAFTVLGTDTLIAALNTFIGTQFDLLCDDIKHMFDDLTTDSNKNLINCIKHHRKILR